MLKDLLFAQLTLELVGQSRFPKLAGDGAVLAQEHRAGELLGDGAGTFTHGSLFDVGEQGSADAPEIDAVVFVEAPVFCCNKGFFHQLRHLTGIHLFPRCWPQLLDDLPITGQQCDRARTVEAGNAPGVGQGGINRFCDGALAEGDTASDGSSRACQQDPVTTGSLHISWVRGLWPTARAVTNIPSTRKGWALA